MKTLKTIAAFLTSIILLTACKTEIVHPVTNQHAIYVSIMPDALSTIDNITIDDSTLKLIPITYGIPPQEINLTGAKPLPFGSGDIGIFEMNIPAGEPESVVKVSIHYVAGETIVFTDSYGVNTATTFDNSSINDGLINTNLKVGLGTQSPAIQVYKTVPASVKIN